MVARTLFAFDSSALTIDASSPFGAAGAAIVNNSSTPDGTIFEFQPGFSRINVELDDTGGDPDTLEDDLAGSHTITNGGGLVANGTGVEAESIIVVRALDALGNETGPEISLTVFSQNGVFSDVWGFGTAEDLDAGTLYVKVSGSNLGTSDYATITCFCRGTLIQTKDGPRAVESIQVGDQIETQTHGLQTVRAALSTIVEGHRLRNNPKLLPVRITAGSLGQNLPRRDLVVSRQHRMQTASKIAERMFGSLTVLLPAIKLTALSGIEIEEQVEAVEYYHLLFDQHEIIFAEGAPTESLYFVPGATASIGPEAKEELLTLFPELADGGQLREPANHIPDGSLQKRLVDRHLKNNKPILTET